ncbi:MAG: hypothetical protein HQL52_07765 [Magnetococcales bacterium]|nr:hypothetical protein [Magnetococcales bacterium]
MMAHDYPVTILRKPERIHLHQQQLGILVDGADIATAFERYREEETRILARYQELEITPPPPPGKGRGGGGREPLRPFMIKSAVVLVVVLVPTILLGAAIREAPRVMAYNLPTALQRVIDTGRGAFETVLDRLEKMSPKSREALRKDMRRLAQNLEPVVGELRPLLTGPPPENQETTPRKPE